MVVPSATGAGAIKEPLAGCSVSYTFMDFFFFIFIETSRSLKLKSFYWIFRWRDLKFPRTASKKEPRCCCCVSSLTLNNITSLLQRHSIMASSIKDQQLSLNVQYWPSSPCRYLFVHSIIRAVNIPSFVPAHLISFVWRASLKCLSGRLRN